MRQTGASEGPGSILSAVVICVLLLSGCATAPRQIIEKPVTKLVAITRPMYIPEKELFYWPVKGHIITPFGVNGQGRSKGIDIKAGEGQAIRAVKAGRVVYCDPNMKGLGNTVILDHGNGLQTVYAYNSAILVGVGDTVERGAVIAKAGSTGRAKEPSLHFEVRRNGEPQNPLYYLP